jgi:hypothetical protein
MKNKETKKPFFAKFLENQITSEESSALNGGDGYTKPSKDLAVTLKYPSDDDEAVTMKYPSDDDEAVTLKYPSDGDDDIFDSDFQ